MATIKPEFQDFSMRPFDSVIKYENRGIESATVVSIDCGFSQRIKSHSYKNCSPAENTTKLSLQIRSTLHKVSETEKHIFVVL